MPRSSTPRSRRPTRWPEPQLSSLDTGPSARFFYARAAGMPTKTGCSPGATSARRSVFRRTAAAPRAPPAHSRRRQSSSAWSNISSYPALHSAAPAVRSIPFQCIPPSITTARGTLPHVWVRHIVDSAQLLHVSRETLPQGEWIDLGTGAGFPGIVIAALAPDRPITLVDSRRLRTEWLQRVADALEVGHVWINSVQAVFVETSWGGTKGSGIGRELGPWGLSGYLSVKHVTRCLG